jgi:hypothetical protein
VGNASAVLFTMRLASYVIGSPFTS